VPDFLDEDDAIIVEACADLAGRSGCTAWEMGYVDKDESVPGSEDKWYCHIQYAGTRIGVSDMDGPVSAAMALSVKLLRGATCRCGKLVTLLGRNDQARCLWRIVERRWTPSCDVEPIHMPEGSRGDLRRLGEAMDQRQREQGGKR